jgi:type I restriction enzyme S subunit
MNKELFTIEEARSTYQLATDNCGLQKGYKQTEVGVIPEDWECVLVGQLMADLILAKPMDGNHGNIHPKSSDFVSIGIPFVMANNIRDGYVDLDNCAYIRKEQADALQKGFSLTGDVLLTHKATIGQIAVVGNIPYEYIMLTPQVTYYRVLDRNRMSNFYLRQFFESYPFQHVLQTMSGGGTRSYIGITAQLDLPIAFPRLITEQRAIATVLSDVDALLAKIDQLITKKRDLKQASMQQLLTGQTRLPGFSFNPKYKNTEVGRIPENWTFSLLNNFCERVSVGLATSVTEHYRPSGVPIIRNLNIKNGYFDDEDMLYISEEFAKANFSKSAKAFDVLTVHTGSNLGQTCVLPRAFHNCHTFTTLITTPKQNILDPYFLCVHMSSYIGRNEMDRLQVGGGKGNLNTGDLKKYRIICPPIDEQRAIASIFSDMDAEITALEARRDKTRDLKQGMMQELLTGRIRLI